MVKSIKVVRNSSVCTIESRGSHISREQVSLSVPRSSSTSLFIPLLLYLSLPYLSANLSLPICLYPPSHSMPSPLSFFRSRFFCQSTICDRFRSHQRVNSFEYYSSPRLTIFYHLSVPPFDLSRCPRSFSPRCLRLTLYSTCYYIVKQPPFVPADRVSSILNQCL